MNFFFKSKYYITFTPKMKNEYSKKIFHYQVKLESNEEEGDTLHIHMLDSWQIRKKSINLILC